MLVRYLCLPQHKLASCFNDEVQLQVGGAQPIVGLLWMGLTMVWLVILLPLRIRISYIVEGIDLIIVLVGILF